MNKAQQLLQFLDEQEPDSSSGLDTTIANIAKEAGVSFADAKKKFKEIEQGIKDSDADVENVIAVAIETLKKALDVE